MRRIITLILLSLATSLYVYSQNFVGAHKLEIKKKMKQKHKDFYFAKEVMGKRNFIKFLDYDELKTFLFVLDDDGYCEYQMLMCDYSLLKASIDLLHKNYEYKQDLVWYDYLSGKQDYVIRIKKEEWYFSIITKKLNKKKK